MSGVLSPLLANVLLDDVDKDLEKRGHTFVRYADDCCGYVRSRRAGERVMQTLRRLYAKLHLRINESKSAVAQVQDRKFLVATNPFASLLKRLRRASRRRGAEATREPWTSSRTSRRASGSARPSRSRTGS